MTPDALAEIALLEASRWQREAIAALSRPMTPAPADAPKDGPK